jgi:hypothetical protein
LAVLLPLLLSVLPISIARISEDGPVKLIQLVYLSIVVGAAGWTSWRAVKDKNDPDRFRGIVFRILGTALLGLGVLLMVVGIASSNVLAVGFSSIGIVYGGAMGGFLGRRVAADWWLTWHLNERRCCLQPRMRLLWVWSSVPYVRTGTGMSCTL